MFQQLLNNPMFRQQLNNFAQNIMRQGINPQQMVQQLLNSGKMTQAQFEQFRPVANQMTGQRF